MAAPGREYKVVLAGAFGSGKTTFASQFVKAKAEKKKIRKSLRAPFRALNVTMKQFTLRVKLWLKCVKSDVMHIAAAIKAETFPVNLYTSAGTVKLTLYDTTLHAKVCR